MTCTLCGDPECEYPLQPNTVEAPFRPAADPSATTLPLAGQSLVPGDPTIDYVRCQWCRGYFVRPRARVGLFRPICRSCFYLELLRRDDFWNGVESVLSVLPEQSSVRRHEHAERRP